MTLDVQLILTLALPTVETFRTPEQLEDNRYLAQTSLRRDSSEI